jgi:two-component system, LuxR family, response regulator FixJ
MDFADSALFVVDDDATARRAVEALASSLNIPCRSFSSAEEFLDYHRPSLAGCLLLDVGLPGMSGLELQERLSAVGSTLPVILISGRADVASAVRGMRRGALTMLEKPYQADELADAIREAMQCHARVRESHAIHAEVQRCLATLTPREHALMEMVITGMPNKRIARILGTSSRTVDRLRARVYEKMCVESAIELAQAVADFRAATVTTPQDSRSGPGRLLDPCQRERQLIAYDLHDGLVQYLTGAAMELDRLGRLDRRCQESSLNAEESLGRAAELIRRSLTEARQLIRGLQPPLLAEHGIVAAIEHLIGEHRQEGGPAIEFLVNLSLPRFAPPLENAIYRVVQESLTNAVRHSQSAKVRVELVEHDGHIRVDIRDWGIGFNPAELDSGRIGLQGIQQWAHLLGGHATIEAAPQQGTRVSAEFPSTQDEERKSFAG